MSFQETGGGGDFAEEDEAGEEEEEEGEEVEEVDVASLDGAVAEATMTAFAKLAGLLCTARDAAAFRSRAGVMDTRSDEVPTREARSIAELRRECVRLKREVGRSGGASEQRK